MTGEFLIAYICGTCLHVSKADHEPSWCGSCRCRFVSGAPLGLLWGRAVTERDGSLRFVVDTVPELRGPWTDAARACVVPRLRRVGMG